MSARVDVWNLEISSTLLCAQRRIRVVRPSALFFLCSAWSESSEFGIFIVGMKPLLGLANLNRTKKGDNV